MKLGFVTICALSLLLQLSFLVAFKEGEFKVDFHNSTSGGQSSSMKCFEHFKSACGSSETQRAFSTLCHVAVQKCGDSAFCKTLRGKAGDGYELRPGSIAVKGSALKAKLVNAAVQKEIDLTLTAYEGLVRITIDEGDKDRFKVA